MEKNYTAAARQNLGRKSWLADFRHPLKLDNANRPGRKTRKGLGTENQVEAEGLIAQLNEILRDQTLWSLGARAEAAIRFDPRVVDIFYAEIEPRSRNARLLREQYLPLPSATEGYSRVLLLGVPGAGKTTLLRQLIGSHPERDRFPSTSVNRTTTFPTEVITREDGFSAVVTFLSEHEARFEVEEAVSSAVLRAVDGSKEEAARVFLEQSDMRFRLKYLLGDYSSLEEEEDPYAEEVDTQVGEDDMISSSEALLLKNKLESYVTRLVALAKKHRDVVEEQHGKLDTLTAEDRNSALDLIQEDVENSAEYTELVSDVLDEIRGKFDLIQIGHYEKSTTGWPMAWRLEKPTNERKIFLDAVRFFSGNSVKSWGKLLTPLVNGLRVAGYFFPEWNSDHARIILIDTEGLGHKANSSADLPEHIVYLFNDSDVILLVDSAKNAMTHFSAGKALEGVVTTGNTKKLAVAFTHMDAVSGESLKGRAKYEHVRNGLRNVADNQVAKNVSTAAARHLLDHLKDNTFFLGDIDKADAKKAHEELNRLMRRLQEGAPPIVRAVAFPKYSTDHLVLAIQEAALSFRTPWKARLGLERHPKVDTEPWQSIKAMSRRYAENFDDGYHLQPSSNLRSSLGISVSRFLENPDQWSADTTPDEKREIIDRIKSLVTNKLGDISKQRIKEQPQSTWLEAYNLRGAGSTFNRKHKVEAIYARWVPVPDGRGDPVAKEFLDEVKHVVTEAIEIIKEEVKNQAVKPPKMERKLLIALRSKIKP